MRAPKRTRMGVLSLVLGAAAVAVVVGVLFWAAASRDGGPAEVPAALAVPGVSEGAQEPSSVEEPAADSGAGERDVDDAPVVLEDVPGLSAEDLEGGREAAVAAMAAFTNRLAPAEQWWAELSPLLSIDARFHFESVDPWKVPASQVLDAVVVGAPDYNFMAVLVDTDAGQYRVELVRESVGQDWLVFSMRPVEALR